MNCPCDNWFGCLMVSTFLGYLMPKRSLKRTAVILYNTVGGKKEFNIFSISSSLKENVITSLEFELTYFKVTVPQFSNYATEPTNAIINLQTLK